MGLLKLLFSYFGNGHRDNIIFELDAGESMTLNFKDSGINSATNKYYGLGDSAKKVHIRVGTIASITHINGVELQSPITLGTATPNVWSVGFEWKKITVRADQNSTFFEVYAS